MKTINSIVGLTLALGMTLAIPFSSSAIEPANQKTTIEALAYRNIDNAKDLAEYNSILAARNTLIYGDQSWTIDGAVKVFNADGTVEELPDFYDLFPSDWEPGKLPDAESNTANSIFNNIPQPWNERSSALYYGNTYFKLAHHPALHHTPELPIPNFRCKLRGFYLIIYAVLFAVPAHNAPLFFFRHSILDQGPQDRIGIWN